MRVAIALPHASFGFIYSTLSRVSRAGSETKLVASSKYIVRDFCDALRNAAEERKADTPVLLLNAEWKRPGPPASISSKKVAWDLSLQGLAGILRSERI